MTRKRGGRENVRELPNDFIGTSDEQHLESFAGYLIAHGLATRWHRNRKSGIDVSFEIFGGGCPEKLLFCIGREREADVFYVTDSAGKRLDEGALEHVMAAVDRLARGAGSDELA